MTKEGASNHGVDISDIDAIDAEERRRQKMRRIIANRKAERASYWKKKNAITNLESCVKELVSDREQLKLNNARLRQEIQEVKAMLRVALLTTRSNSTLLPLGTKQAASNTSSCNHATRKLGHGH